jgi:hypothetical protein
MLEPEDGLLERYSQLFLRMEPVYLLALPERARISSCVRKSRPMPVTGKPAGRDIKRRLYKHLCTDATGELHKANPYLMVFYNSPFLNRDYPTPEKGGIPPSGKGTCLTEEQKTL